MSKKEKPLPRPHRKPFGAKEQNMDQQLLSDRMAAAVAEGRIEQFLQEELPDSEHARSLAMMMMGMSGMMPGGAAPASPGPPAPPAQDETAADAPAGVRDAVQAGDVKSLMDLLRQEHQKRTGEPVEQERPAHGPEASGLSPDEQDTLDKLLTICRENNVEADWVVLRALKLYIQEYRRTGRL